MRRSATKVRAAPKGAGAVAVATPRLPSWLIAAVLALVTIALYWPAKGFDFINCDDPQFITSNAHVQGGLSWEAVKWAFEPNQGDYWHPLAWLSLMLDVSLFGQGPAGLHATNVAIHAANGALLFLLLRLLTGAFWRSLAVAALFALHPLRVESVAWVTERKDVLSGFFGLLALIAYARYASKARASNQWAVISHQSSVISHQSAGARAPESRSLITDHRLLFYLLSLLFFACGLMTKAMLVTWPCVMLLLDVWPLRRLDLSTLNSQLSTLLRLVREKIPFFILGVGSGVLTYLTESGRREAVGAPDPAAWQRLENALVAYARYIGKTFWPLKLAMPYTNPGNLSGLEVGTAALLVLGACFVMVRLGWRRPCLLVGWCWFLGTLIPVVGLTKGWGIFMADRFTYVPSIGLLILTVWGVCELAAGWRYRAPILWVIGSAAVVLCLTLTRQQLGYWRDSEALFRHALEVTVNNRLAHSYLGFVLEKKGALDDAIFHFQESVRLSPNSPTAHYDLAGALSKKGQVDEAIAQYREALRLNPDDAGTLNDLGNAFDKKGQSGEAIQQYQEATRVKPEDVLAHSNLGIALGKVGRMDEAIFQFQEVLRLKPDYADAHYNLGVALVELGRLDEAILHYQEALRLQPTNSQASGRLAAAFGKKGQTDEAIRQFGEAIRLKPDDPETHYGLGVAFANQGRMSEAISHFQQTLRLRPDDPQVHNSLGIALYQQRHTGEAIQQFQEALRLKPDFAEAQKNLLVALSASAEVPQPPGGASTNR